VGNKIPVETQAKKDFFGHLQRIVPSRRSSSNRVFFETKVLPILEEKGNVEVFLAWLTKKNLSGQVSPLVRRAKKKAISGVRSKVRKHLRKTEMLQYVRNTTSERNWDRNVCDESSILEPGASKKTRVKMGFGSKLPKKKSSRALNAELSESFKDKITEFSREIPVRSKNWPHQGEGVYRQLDEAILTHLDRLQKRNMFHDFYLECDELEFWFSISGDGSKMKQNQWDTASHLIAFNLQILPEEHKFPGIHVPFVHRNIHWMFLNEVETCETVCCHSKLILSQMEMLSKKKYFFSPRHQPAFWEEKKGDPILSLEEEVTLKEVKLRIAYWLGDSKFLQIFTGTPMSTSGDRCYLCHTPQVLWKDQNLPLATRNTAKDIKNIFTVFGFHSMDVKSLSSTKTPMLFSHLSSFDQIYRVLDDSNLWGLTVMADPLHIIHNHSHQLKTFLKSQLKTEDWEKVKVLVKQVSGQTVPKVGTSVRNWRLIWASCSVTWKSVIKSTELYDLVWSWAAIIRLLYQPVDKRDLASFFRYFSVCLYHFTLWKKLVNFSPASKFLLGIHLLYPHTVEQFYEVSPILFSTERHEFSWSALRGYWNISGRKKKPLRNLFEKALFIENHKKPPKHRPVSLKLRKYDDDLTVKKIEISGYKLDDFIQVRNYLESKEVPSAWYRYQDEECLILEVPNTHDIPPLPSYSVFYERKGEGRKKEWLLRFGEFSPLNAWNSQVTMNGTLCNYFAANGTLKEFIHPI